MLGFFGLFGIQGIPALLNGDWLQAIWVVWFVWFIYFIPTEKKSTWASIEDLRGVISDKIDQKKSLIIMAAFQGAMMIIFPYLAETAWLLCLIAAAIVAALNPPAKTAELAPVRA